MLTCVCARACVVLTGMCPHMRTGLEEVAAIQRQLCSDEARQQQHSWEGCRLDLVTGMRWRFDGQEEGDLSRQIPIRNTPSVRRDIDHAQRLVDESNGEELGGNDVLST